MVCVGQKVIFRMYKGVEFLNLIFQVGDVIEGTVIEINDEHKWFRVEYGPNNLKTCFKFCDIGKRVEIVGGGKMKYKNKNKFKKDSINNKNFDMRYIYNEF